MHYFSNLFWYRTLHVSDRFTVHHQESSTVYTATGICHASCVACLLARSGCSSLTSLAHNKFEKQCISLVFMMRIYHDAQSSECQKLSDEGSVVECDNVHFVPKSSIASKSHAQLQ